MSKKNKFDISITYEIKGIEVSHNEDIRTAIAIAEAMVKESHEAVYITDIVTRESLGDV